METALANVRVLDLTRALAGPFGAMILGDLRGGDYQNRGRRLQKRKHRRYGL